MKDIEGLVSDIKNKFSENETIDNIINDLDSLSSSFGNSSTGLHASGKLAKAFSKGNPLENIPSELKPFQTFLTLPDNQNIKWLGWHNKGHEFFESSDDCPYCTTPAQEKKETIQTIKTQVNQQSWQLITL